MSLRYSIICFAVLIGLFSCNRVKKKGKESLDKAEEKVAQAKEKLMTKKDSLTEKLIPTYDSDIADTEYNKKRFKEHLKIELTKDVKEIYAYGDFLGADYKVLLSFKCSKETLQSVVKVKGMKLSEKGNDEGLLFGEEFKWWNKRAIEKIRP